MKCERFWEIFRESGTKKQELFNEELLLFCAIFLARILVISSLFYGVFLQVVEGDKHLPQGIRIHVRVDDIPEFYHVLSVTRP